MNLDFLKGRNCTEIIRHEYSWQFVFGEGCSLTIECPWRVVAGGRIAIAQSDHQQKFGLPAPVDVPAEMSNLLSEAIIVDVTVAAESSDIRIDFDNGARLELFADSQDMNHGKFKIPTANFGLALTNELFQV